MKLFNNQSNSATVYLKGRAIHLRSKESQDVREDELPDDPLFTKLLQIGALRLEPDDPQG